MDIDRFLNAPNYYVAMNLDHKNITQKQIQESYRKLAKQFHPDKNKHPRATESFAKLNEIKEILSDDTKRIDYNKKIFPASPPVRRIKSAPINSMKPDYIADQIRQFYFAEKEQQKIEKEKQKKKAQKQKNIIFPLIGIFILLLIFTFVSNTQPFSNSITKATVSKVLVFDFPEDSYFEHSEYRSKILGKQFYVPKTWEKDHIYESPQGDWQRLREQLCAFADDIFVEMLQKKCEKEKMESGVAQPSCYELRKLHLSM
ncbi:hypothetical protein TRFO_31271 [Tritrichomonas foetus]|uniref:J domain-containing protein n=1 Tax=Tritrichomonas foetus TaxID=1144522 RepID=A0A1J4JRJ4_9EUKA|nr:hypothetical protein TRFO_31271 [Tritrichomonas foetus]|eukprot:OHT01759.1 hypothetical protein TRFO_31271 [Tritrichomonas foetus]